MCLCCSIIGLEGYFCNSLWPLCFDSNTWQGEQNTSIYFLFSISLFDCIVWLSGSIFTFLSFSPLLFLVVLSVKLFLLFIAFLYLHLFPVILSLCFFNLYKLAWKYFCFIVAHFTVLFFVCWDVFIHLNNSWNYFNFGFIF